MRINKMDDERVLPVDIELGATYVILKGKFKNEIVIPVDGEKVFNEIGLSHGWIHFVRASDPTKKFGFCGMYWFEENTLKLPF